ncbi:response regulator [Reichenbachiella sp. MALMAid0571]|uniref:response regulator n=1 Tax=Reichenbachiella sp. MALMAid0571 TaxID=3143939 RepID=UPI0032DE3D66
MNNVNNILLVDDDDTGTFLTKIVIKKLDQSINVDNVWNGKEALDYFGGNDNTSLSKHPDLILLDINMPIMNGFEFLEEFNGNNTYPKNIPIVILTTSTYSNDFKQAIKYNVLEFLEKPLSVDMLSSVLDKVRQS